MHHIKFSTIFLIALLVLSTEVVAQKIYKCGTTYSQQACPDGVIVPAAPTPDTAKTAAADQATRRDALTADRMEKSRLQQEKKDLAANTPDFKRKARATSTQAEVKPLVKKRKTMDKDEEFRAVVPGTVTPKNRSKK
jgi:hypothetical protein